MTDPSLEKTKTDQSDHEFIDSMLYVLEAPHVTWFPHQSVIPDMVQRAEIERFKNIDEIMGKEETTDYDIIVYLHTFPLWLPLSHSVAKILFHCLAKYFDIKTIFEDEYFLKHYAELDDDEKIQLQRFKQWLFKIQMMQLKKKKKSMQTKTNDIGKKDS